MPSGNPGIITTSYRAGEVLLLIPGIGAVGIDPDTARELAITLTDNADLASEALMKALTDG